MFAGIHLKSTSIIINMINLISKYRLNMLILTWLWVSCMANIIAQELEEESDSYEERRRAMFLRNKMENLEMPHSKCHVPQTIGRVDYRHLNCSRNGTRYESFNCPIEFGPNDTFAVCTNMTDIVSTKDLKLPQNTTVICLGNTTLRQIPNNSFVDYPNLKFINISYNKYLAEIDDAAFEGSNSLEYFAMTHVKILKLKPAIFEHLPNLTKLDLSYWQPLLVFARKELKQHLQLKWLQGLEHSRIQELILDGINYQSSVGIFWELEHPLFSSISKTKLQYLSLKHNQIIAVRKHVVPNFKHLVGLDISHNILLGVDIEMVSESLEMKELQFIDISNQNFIDPGFSRRDPSYAPDYDTGKLLSSVKTDNEFCFPIMFPPKLKTIIASNNRIVIPDTLLNSILCLNGKNNLTEICMDHFSLAGKFKTVLKFLPNVKTLSLRGSKLEFSNFTLMQNLSALEYLDMSWFNLDWILDTKEKWDIFAQNAHLPNLTYLNIGGNYLVSNYTYQNFFKNLPSLQTLHLNRNQFTNIPVNISNLTSLIYLNLAKNKISDINKTVFTEWFNFSKIKAQRNETLTINLKNNSLQCECADIENMLKANDMKNYIQFTDFVCKFDKFGPVYIYNRKKLLKIKRYCRSEWHPFIIFYLYAFIIISYSTGIVGYRFRHSLRYVWYFYKLATKKAQPCNHFTHDAYFICSTQDLTKVERIYTTLQNTLGYKLFIFERDTVGGFIMDSLKEPFNYCQNVIFVLSKTATKGNHFKYLVNVTQQFKEQNGTNVICIILDRDYFRGTKYGWNTLDYLLCTSKCLFWKTNEEPRSDFFIRISAALGPPMVNVQQDVSQNMV